MKKTKDTNKGITLIALVITIIVMLILVAVTINMAVNGGLFENAGKAMGDTENARDNELQIANGRVEIGGKLYNSIDEYMAEINGNGNTGNNEVLEVPETFAKSFKAGDNITAYLVENETSEGEEKTYDILFIGTGEMYAQSQWPTEIVETYEDLEILVVNWSYKIKKAKISSGITSIGDDAFRYCDKLTEVTIPDSVTSIGGAAFFSCISLTSITIPDSVTSIGGTAFFNCTSLTSITIPNSVTTIGGNAFYNVGHISYHGTAEGSPWGAAELN